MNPAYKRLMFAGLFVFVALVFLGLWAYDVVKIDFISFMEIQPSFDVQEQPLPVPARSVPIEGPAFIPNMGAPTNPVPADDVSIRAGKLCFPSIVSCVMVRMVRVTGSLPL